MTENEKMKEYDFEANLTFLLVGKNGKKVWLAPKVADIGAKRLNGYGGKIEESDLSRKSGAIREIWQESLVYVKEEDLELCAIGYFENIKADGTSFVCKVYIYKAWRYVGVPRKTKEMGKPKKYSRYNMPFKRMMVADRYWLPEFLKGRKFIVRATMRNGQSELVGKVEIEYVDSFE